MNNYLRGNPDPKRDYECQWSLGPLGIPCLVPLLPATAEARDPISIADTDCRMEWQYAHMRQTAREVEPCDVERGVRRRVLGYPRRDGLMWVHPAAWTGPTEAVAGEWASTWGSARILVTLAETGAFKAHVHIHTSTTWGVDRIDQVGMYMHTLGRAQRLLPNSRAACWIKGKDR
jgi:hypothetical protein